MLRIERIPLNAHEMFHTAVCPDQLKVTLRGRSQEYLMGTINRSAPRWRQAERQYSAGRSIAFWSLCEASKGCLVRRSRAWFLKLSLAGPAPNNHPHRTHISANDPLDSSRTREAVCCPQRSSNVSGVQFCQPIERHLAAWPLDL